MFTDYGKFTKLINLAVGTKFYVINGARNGEIVLVSGEKKVYVVETKKVLNINQSDELAIDIK